MALVSIVETPHYSLPEVRGAVRRHLELLEGSALPQPGMKVVLKPNLLMKRRPEEVTTTHPVLVEAVVLELQALGITDITLIDSPGGPYNPTLLEGIYRASGLAEVAERTGITLNADCTFVHKYFPQGETSREFNILTPLTQADYIINLPKIKTHGMTTMSGSVKNLFGSVPGLQKPELHFRFPNNEEFCNMLVDLSLLVAPQLTIVDGIIAMEGDGPSGGKPKQVGLTLASTNPYYLDLIQAAVMGLEPEQVATVNHAIRRGLCPATVGEVELVGDLSAFGNHAFVLPKSSRTVDFISHVPPFLRKPANWLRQKWLTPHPIIRTQDCVGCGKCAESCPAHTIHMEDHKAVIDYSNCIRCYCCHEMCPVRAIDIRRLRVFDL